MKNNHKDEVLVLPQEQPIPNKQEQPTLQTQEQAQTNNQDLPEQPELPQMPQNQEKSQPNKQDKTPPQEQEQFIANKQEQPTPNLNQTQQNPPTQTLRRDRMFVLDTNVLLHDPNAIFSFRSVMVGIPFIVLEELDTFKKESGEKGRNAREVIRNLDELRERGSLGTGVDLNHNTGGAVLKVLSTPQLDDILTDNPQSIKDNYILQTVQNLKKENYLEILFPFKRIFFNYFHIIDKKSEKEALARTRSP